MATLLLTAVGTAIGGPIGGMIGALAGQAADAMIFKPKGREGPRLSDLNVQTSRYGNRIPRLFGTMRVAGTVIWATDLKESRSTSGGGKGQPSVTSYAYSASFAVALSARAISGIGRIWADGNLLRGAAGDFKAPVGAFRVHGDVGGQAVDPLIAAAVGIDQAPACRDMAYVLFEDLQLADFGNRIPSLTFEMVADAGPVTVSAIAAALFGEPVAYLGAQEPVVIGYAADGSDAGEALAPLLEAYRLRWRAEGAGLRIVETVATGRALAADAELRAIDGRELERGAKRRTPIEQVPARLSVRHFDPGRDYQIGVQAAERPGPGTGQEERDLPAVLSPDAARAVADRALRAQMRERQTVTRASGWAVLDLQPGDLVEIEGEAGDWAVEALDWEEMAPRLSLRAHAAGTARLPDAGDGGQPVRQPDLVQGATQLALIELAPPDDRLADAPLVYAAATGADAGWRRAALFRYRPETASAEPLGGTAPAAVLGRALTVLGSGAQLGEAWTMDLRHSVDVQLGTVGDALLSVDDDALMRGANLCALGPELLQFGRADPIGLGRYRLSRLVRGWRGSEWAMGAHLVDERFVLIEAERLVVVPVALAEVGTMLEVRAVGLGDVTPVSAALAIDGRGVLSPSPVHGRVVDAGDGDLLVQWMRRSRLGWAWRDDEVPLGEEREAYRIVVKAGAVTLREAEVTGPEWRYGAVDRASDAAAAGAAALVIEVRQIGTHGVSRALVVSGEVWLTA